MLHCSDSEATTFYAYVDDVDWSGFEFHVADQAFAGVFPCHGQQACVWMLRPYELMTSVIGAGRDRPSVFVDHLAGIAPDLGERVRHGRLLAPVRGAARLPNYRRTAHGPGWALVGDAGFHRDPITGHGISDALRDAELLAAALHDAIADPNGAEAALGAYQASRDAMGEPVLRLTEQLVTFPPTPHFVQLQRELGEVLDVEAAQL